MIRPATMADADAIRGCALAAFAPYVSRIGRAPAPMRADPVPAIARGEALVAADPGGAVLGYVICHVVSGVMRLETVAVWPACAGQGIGRGLIAHVEQLARSQGLGTVTLYTHAAMTENLRLYPALGYVAFDRRAQDGFDRVFFRKVLAQSPIGCPR